MDTKENRIEVLVYINGDPADFMSDAEFLATYHPELLASIGPVVAVPPVPDKEPDKPVVVATPLSALLGKELKKSDGGNPVYQGLDQDVLYEKTGEDRLWPRQTLTNPNPEGNYAVPGKFTPPKGWYWKAAESGDGAWSIVNYPTSEKGPTWLLDTPQTKPSTLTAGEHYEMLPTLY